MTERSDSELLEGCRRGNQAAMKAFYERYYGYALSVCLAYANDREDARELLNDGFLKIFQNLKSLKNSDVLVPWMRRILVNTAIDHHRKTLKRAVEIPVDAVEYRLEEPYQNDAALFAQLSAENILNVLQQLPLPYRLVFSLYVLEGYSHREIAERLHLAESTSRAHLTEANRLMRSALTAQINEDYERTKRYG